MGEIYFDENLYFRYIHNGTLTDYYINPYDKGVFSEKTNKFLKPTIDRNGYVVYSLYIDGKCHRIGYHQLVASTMYGVPLDPLKNEVDHLDGDKQHNHYRNLEWVTRKENVNRSIKLGLKKPSIGENNGMCSYSDETVHDVLNMLSQNISISDTATRLGVEKSFIYNLIQGNTRTNIRNQYIIPNTVYKHRHHNKRADYQTKQKILALKEQGYSAREIHELTEINFQIVKNVYYYKKKSNR